MADSFLFFSLVIRLRLKGVACQERIVLRNEARTVSLVGGGAEVFFGRRKRKAQAMGEFTDEEIL
jgi:hypothetical protein